MPKKIPMRQCLGCREMKPKPELLRVVRSPEGEVSLDTRGKKPGRGAYVCPNADCLRRAVKSRALSRALETQIPDEVMERLAAALEAGQDG
ncbi:MAG TPA: YlxR family protein [Candidatus Scatomorpha merdipullorum]|uniref:YlxR family protein n=1 Tax=Candidatus Scatomorpha merdipullorum TaxID=2840927 RepID=A0A9D1FDR4_9FIRM|nr:YlxR family protein [Candidatus Scatomorpha merdipullorum]